MYRLKVPAHGHICYVLESKPASKSRQNQKVKAVLILQAFQDKTLQKRMLSSLAYKWIKTRKSGIFKLNTVKSQKGWNMTEIRTANSVKNLLPSFQYHFFSF